MVRIMTLICILQSECVPNTKIRVHYENRHKTHIQQHISVYCFTCNISHRTAMTIGVVKHAVNTSAGYCGFNGNISLPRHDASTIVL